MRTFSVAASLLATFSTLTGAYTLHDSCNGERAGQIHDAFSEMRAMASNAAEVLAKPQDQKELRVELLQWSLVGTANQDLLVERFQTLSGLGNVNTPDMVIYCNDDHFEYKDVRSNGQDIRARHDTDNDLYYTQIIGDGNGRLCTDSPGNESNMGYRYPNRKNPDVDYVVLCDRLFDPNRNERKPGLSIEDYSLTDQFTGNKDDSMLDLYHLLPATLLHEMTHTGISGIRSDDVVHNNNKLYGFARCYNYRKDLTKGGGNLDDTLKNADTYATLAVGLYLEQNNWAWGWARPADTPDPRKPAAARRLKI